MSDNEKEPEAKKAKLTSSSLSDALFGAPQGGNSAAGSQEDEAGREPDAEAEAAPVATKLSPGSRKMTPPQKNRTTAAASPRSGYSPFDATAAARFASQSTQLRQRNLVQEMEMGPEDADGDGGGDGGDGDDDDDEAEVSKEYYAEQYEQEEEGPDGLTHSERLYLQREYETTTLTEREWLIRQRRRRRLTGDAQIQTLNLCTETVGTGSFMPVKLWRDSAPDVIAANNKARKLASTAAGNADDPYDLLHSDDEADGDRSLVLKRQQSLSMCQAIMSNVGLLVIRNARPEPSSASASEMIDSDVEIVGTTGSDSIGGSSHQDPIFPPDLMNKLAAAAREIELELCERLDAKGEKWRALEDEDSGTKMSLEGPKEDGGNSPIGDEKKDDGVVLVDTIPEEEMKMPSRETAAKEEEERRIKKEKNGRGDVGMNFRYHEVASRCIGRIDSRYRMDQYPFNDPRVTSNPVLLPIIKQMLGGENGNAELVYAGLIFSFPGSQNQPWHQDGEPLFPEEDIDVPPYAFNVFIPIDDVTEELGPTEFIPGTLLSDRAEEINDEELVQWAMIESKWSAAGDHKASMRMVLGAEEDEWMSKNKVVAPLLLAGDVLIYDYRTCHRGTENLSQTKTRTMLYLMYARPWLKEHLNFGSEKLFGDVDGSR